MKEKIASICFLEKISRTLHATESYLALTKDFEFLYLHKIIFMSLWSFFGILCMHLQNFSYHLHFKKLQSIRTLLFFIHKTLYLISPRMKYDCSLAIRNCASRPTKPVISLRN